MSTNFAVSFNNASSTVGTNGYTTGSGSLTLTTGGGARFPALTSGQIMRVTVSQAAYAYSPTATTANYTIYTATGISGDTITGLALSTSEGQTQVDRNYSAGDVVEIRVTAGTLNDMQTAISGITGAVGSSGNVQFNNSGAFGAISSTSFLSTTGSGQLQLPGNVTFQDWHDTSSSWDHACWINMPTPAPGTAGGTNGGPSGIGSGGVGANAWIAYAAGSGQWFSDANAGDICSRNVKARLLLGCTTGYSQIQVTSSTVNFNSPTTSTVAITVNGLSGQSVDLQQWKNSSGTVLTNVHDDGSIGLPAIANASAANNSLFWDTINSKLCYKDPSGNLHEI